MNGRRKGNVEDEKEDEVKKDERKMKTISG
jgi:hypothetical protein